MPDGIQLAIDQRLTTVSWWIATIIGRKIPCSVRYPDKYPALSQTPNFSQMVRRGCNLWAPIRSGCICLVDRCHTRGVTFTSPHLHPDQQVKTGSQFRMERNALSAPLDGLLQNNPGFAMSNMMLPAIQPSVLSLVSLRYTAAHLEAQRIFAEQLPIAPLIPGHQTCRHPAGSVRFYHGPDQQQRVLEYRGV